MQMGRIGWKT